MLLVRAGLSLTLLAALATSAIAATPVHHRPTGHHTSAHKAKKAGRTKLKGQRQIDSSRAREIQQALIHENYLSGEPTGTWDAETQQAMRKFQSDHGWQTKIMPDSRALIKLGLGPANPDGSSATTGQTRLEVPGPQGNSILEGDHSRAATDHAGR
jgi:peptidoglycan hydrolase-like protein with peptidoglycan-binding domain